MPSYVLDPCGIKNSSISDLLGNVVSDFSKVCWEVILSAYSLDSYWDELSSDDEELSLEEEELLDEELSSLLLLEGLSIIGEFLLLGFMLELLPLLDLLTVLSFGSFNLDFYFSGVFILKPLRLLPAELDFCSLVYCALNGASWLINLDLLENFELFEPESPANGFDIGLILSSSTSSSDSSLLAKSSSSISF